MKKQRYNIFVLKTFSLTDELKNSTLIIVRFCDILFGIARFCVWFRIVWQFVSVLDYFIYTDTLVEKTTLFHWRQHNSADCHVLLTAIKTDTQTRKPVNRHTNK